MAWVAATPELLDDLVAFLTPREWGCVAVAAALVGERGVRVPTGPRHRLFVHLDPNLRVSAAILRSAGGILYPVLGDSRAVRTIGRGGSGRLRKLLGSAARRVYSIVGVERDVLALQAMLGLTPRNGVEYYLMEQDLPLPSMPDPRLPARLSLRNATPADAGAIFEIQRGYEIEEVLLDSSTFDPGVSMKHLKLVLATQRVIIAEIDGVAVAKAGTNARGIGYEQIGGVYTAPEYRSRGVAARLMQRLVEEIGQAGKRSALFVKRTNAPALRLYEKLGFATRDSFRITYYS